MLPENFKNWEEFLFRFRYPILAFLVGIILLGLGFFLTKNGTNLSGTKVEVLEATTEGQEASSFVVVEIAGQVEKPGVYKLPSGVRIEDLLIVSGGLSQNADRVWVEKSLNRAAKLSDGQKIYIPMVGEHSDSLSAKNSGIYQNISSSFSDQGSGLVDINRATLKELDALPGIGQVYAQNIIEHRPYSSIGELLSKGVLKKSVYEKIKDKIVVY
ncbi:helix-hairpin-helix domain-containing protein [Candidatus Woesebacteria bacterium]|nr:helix-hairpin-helix domain-containing protein [Candidatus Woesebacteria bacterium]